MPRKYFSPGTSMDNSYRMIRFISVYNATHPNSNQECCLCKLGKFDKNTPGITLASENTSTATRISRIIRLNQCKTIQYGNSYLGTPINLNYLGKFEGMSGGSGSAPKNKF